MSKLQSIRALFTERLTVVVNEIFVAAEKTIAEYEEEVDRTTEENARLQRLLDLVFKPDIQLHKTDAPQSHGPGQSHCELEFSIKMEEQEEPETQGPVKVEVEEELWNVPGEINETEPDEERHSKPEPSDKLSANPQSSKYPFSSSEDSDQDDVSEPWMRKNKSLMMDNVIPDDSDEFSDSTPDSEVECLPLHATVKSEPETSDSDDESPPPCKRRHMEPSLSSTDTAGPTPAIPLGEEVFKVLQQGESTAHPGRTADPPAHQTCKPHQQGERRPGMADFSLLHVTEPSPLSPPSLGEITNEGTVWTVMEPGSQTGRHPTQNAGNESAGPTPFAKRKICDKLSAFMCLFDSAMLENIQQCTIAEARRAGEHNATWEISTAELKAFIALLYVRGAICGKNLELDSLWADKWGNAFFPSTFSRNRFREIMRYLCFHREQTERIQDDTDRFAHLREVWDCFMRNCNASYKPGSDITVDEQLFPSKSQCPFAQSTPNKPDKYGIKFYMAADVESKYLLNGFPCLTLRYRPRAQSVGENIVLQLVEPYLDEGRNITMNNFFTSISLAKVLLSRNTTLVGTIDHRKTDLPPSARKQMASLHSTKLMRNDKLVLTVYQCEERKNVVLLSTQHQQVVVSEEGRRKPETVLYYDRTKVGVDVVDQMARQYSVKAATCRWPLACFYNMLDLAAINAWVLYQSCRSQNLPRRNFIVQLAEELRAEWMVSKQPLLAPLTLSDVFAEEEEPKKRSTCMVNANCSRNRTIHQCQRCGKGVCGRCTGKIQRICSKCVSAVLSCV